MLKFFLPLILLFAECIVVAQPAVNRFALIDKRVKTINSSTADSLSKKLTVPYKTQLDKVRSIFRWITEHIAYDVEGMYNPDVYKGLHRPGIAAIDSVVKKDYNDRIVEKVLRERKAICDGYARLFKTLCDYAGLQSVVIIGNGRRYTDPFREEPGTNHAWNAVLIDQKWYLLDATWASGTVDETDKIFTKGYNNFYFLTDPAKLISTHYPEELKWSLLADPPSRKQFFTGPFIADGFYSSAIISFKPVTGTIELTAVKRKFRIELETNDAEKDLIILEYPAIKNLPENDAEDDSLSFEELEKKYAPKYKIEGKKIYQDYELKSLDATRIEVFYKGNLVLCYAFRVFR